jgi:transcriptional regulator with XRE-family HTH domain
MTGKNLRFDDWLAEQMEDPEFVAEMEKTEAGYEVERLRIGRGLTQAQLAELVGCGVGRIDRLESGEMSPQIEFLRKVVRALGGDLRIVVSDVGSRLSGEIGGVGKRYARLLVQAGTASAGDLAG